MKACQINLLLRDPGLCGLWQDQREAESTSCRNWCFSSYSFAVQLGRRFSVCTLCIQVSWTQLRRFKFVAVEVPVYFKAAHEGFGCQIAVSFQRESSVQISWALLEILACKYAPERLSVLGFLGHDVLMGT